MENLKDKDKVKEEYEEESKGKLFFKFILKLIIAFLILYITGWNLLFNVNVLDVLILGSKSLNSFILGPNGFAILINEGYYGLYIMDRFFYSPAIAWIGLIIAIGIIF